MGSSGCIPGTRTPSSPGTDGFPEPPARRHRSGSPEKRPEDEDQADDDRRRDEDVVRGAPAVRSSRVESHSLWRVPARLDDEDPRPDRRHRAGSLRREPTPGLEAIAATPSAYLVPCDRARRRCTARPVRRGRCAPTRGETRCRRGVVEGAPTIPEKGGLATTAKGRRGSGTLSMSPCTTVTSGCSWYALLELPRPSAVQFDRDHPASGSG